MTRQMSLSRQLLLRHLHSQIPSNLLPPCNCGRQSFAQLITTNHASYSATKFTIKSYMTFKETLWINALCFSFPSSIIICQNLPTKCELSTITTSLEICCHHSPLLHKHRLTLPWPNFSPFMIYFVCYSEFLLWSLARVWEELLYLQCTMGNI